MEIMTCKINLHIYTHTKTTAMIYGVTSPLPLTQRSQVLFSVGSSSWLRFSPGCVLNCKINVRKFRPQSSSVLFVVICSLTTAMYYSYGRRLSPYVDGWYMVWIIYDGHVITGDDCDPNFLTFVLRLKENPGKKPQPGNWPDQGSNPGPLPEN